jgi:hypothetical protein
MTQRQLRALFWATFPTLPRRRIKDYSGTGLMYPTDTRVTWCDWLDVLEKNGEISPQLAARAVLEGRS